MAVYGIGAYYKGRGDVSRESIDNGFCGFGYTEEEQPALYELMRQVSLGDIVYIKAKTPQMQNEIAIKAIGYVVGKELEEDQSGNDLGFGKKVIWKKKYPSPLRIRLDENNCMVNTYANTLYREYSPKMIQSVMELLFASEG